MTLINRFTGDYRFLSNFWPARVEYDGMTFRTVEHAYQAAKSPLHDERVYISNCRTAGDAKRAGRRVTMRPDWNDVKLDIMSRLLVEKFKDKMLRQMLLATGNVELIEGNDWGDTFWGVCAGRGQNNLGKLLMNVRELCHE